MVRQRTAETVSSGQKTVEMSVAKSERSKERSSRGKRRHRQDGGDGRGSNNSSSDDDDSVGGTGKRRKKSSSSSKSASKKKSKKSKKERDEHNAKKEKKVRKNADSARGNSFKPRRALSVHRICSEKLYSARPRPAPACHPDHSSTNFWHRVRVGVRVGWAGLRRTTETAGTLIPPRPGPQKNPDLIHPNRWFSPSVPKGKYTKSSIY